VTKKKKRKPPGSKLKRRYSQYALLRWFVERVPESKLPRFVDEGPRGNVITIGTTDGRSVSFMFEKGKLEGVYYCNTHLNTKGKGEE
jgi:hypothetical protein